MQININKTVNVDDDVVAQIANNFLEWLDERGYELTIKRSHTGLLPSDEDYEYLANTWVEDVKNRNYD